MASLEELFDRGTVNSCSKWRHYFEIYERYLSKYKGTPCTYLEIGVSKGGSLEIFQEYLGAQARLVGVDISPDCKQYERDRVEILIGDQSDGSFMGDVVASRGPFDIIIDDGGHVADQQIVSFLTLFPHLKEGGIYIVEDLHTTFWLGFQASRFGINFYDFARGLVEKLTLYHIDQRFFQRYTTPMEQRTGSIVLENFAATDVYGIHFYDSVIVFEKRKRVEPSCEVR